MIRFVAPWVGALLAGAVLVVNGRYLDSQWVLALGMITLIASGAVLDSRYGRSSLERGRVPGPDLGAADREQERADGRDEADE